jgi:GNAT superfamily N-acetyltransferase
VHIESDMNFDGPRRIRPDERQDGYRLFELCFGHNISSGLDDTDSRAGDGGWYVMLPTSGSFLGKPVSQINISHSQVSFSGCRLKIGSIGGVCTHPDFRNLGLAGQILEHCAHQLKQEGAQVMLISGGRGLYTRTGNVPAMRFFHFQLLSECYSKSPFLPKVTLRPFDSGVTADFARIYQSEAVGYVRSLAEYPDYFSIGRTWLVEVDSSPLAYLVLQQPWEHRDGQDHGVREVWEYAGGRLALAAGLAQLLDGTGDSTLPHFKELRLAVPWQDFDLVHCMQALGQCGEPGSLPGHTLRLIDFPALRQDLEPYIAARLPDRLLRGLRFEQSGPLLVNPDLGDRTGDRCAIVCDNQRLEMSTAGMTRLVFGDWESPVETWAVGSDLVEVVNSLFPLPSFQPGLNYR